MQLRMRSFRSTPYHHGNWPKGCQDCHEMSHEVSLNISQHFKIFEPDALFCLSIISGIKAASGVRSVGSAAGIGRRRSTRLMTAAEREQLFNLINEEADKMASEGLIPKKQKEAVTKAVRMAVDSGLIDEKEDEK